MQQLIAAIPPRPRPRRSRRSGRRPGAEGRPGPGPRAGGARRRRAGGRAAARLAAALAARRLTLAVPADAAAWPPDLRRAGARTRPRRRRLAAPGGCHAGAGSDGARGRCRPRRRRRRRAPAAAKGSAWRWRAAWSRRPAAALTVPSRPARRSRPSCRRRGAAALGVKAAPGPEVRPVRPCTRRRACRTASGTPGGSRPDLNTTLTLADAAATDGSPARWRRISAPGDIARADRRARRRQEHFRPGADRRAAGGARPGRGDPLAELHAGADLRPRRRSSSGTPTSTGSAAPARSPSSGLEDAFATAICLVEWADRLGRALPARRLMLDLGFVPPASERAAGAARRARPRLGLAAGGAAAEAAHDPGGRDRRVPRPRRLGLGERAPLAGDASARRYERLRRGGRPARS